MKDKEQKNRKEGKMSKIIEQDIRFLNHDGHKLYGVLTYDQDVSRAPVVVMVPGFKGSCANKLFVYLSQHFVKMGYASFRFDPAGCGNSEGEEEDLTISTMHKDLGKAIQAVKLLDQALFGRISDSLVLLGHSLGALIVFWRASLIPDGQKAIIALSPAIDQQGLIPSWFTSYQLQVFKEGKDINTPKGIVGAAYIKEALAKNWMESVSKVKAPTLIIHGGKDEDVPPNYAQAVYDQLGSEKKKLMIIQRADHKLKSREAKQVIIEETITWLQEHL